jgi:heptosyltransferase-2
MRSEGTLKIALRAPNWLGDTVMALPAIGDVVASFPGATIDCFAAPVACAVLERSDLDIRVRPLATPRGRVRMFRDALAVLRRERYALGVVFPPSLSSALLFGLGRVDVRIGYRGHRRGRLLTHVLDDVPRGDRHLSTEYRELVAAAAATLGVRAKLGAAAARVEASAEERARVRERLGARVGPLVVMAPGAVYGPTKRWPSERFAELADRLTRGLDARIVLTGAEADAPVCREVAERAACAPLDLAGRTRLHTLVALLAESDLVVSNDSGAMHLAAAAGARVVAIFGSTNPRWTAPLGDRTRVIWRREVCAPCYRRRCPIGEVCLTRITVDDVLDACREHLPGSSNGVLR